MSFTTIIENDNAANLSKDMVTSFLDNPTAPVRILVSAATHLVPGDGWCARIEFMQNAISRHHWDREFEVGSDRFESYNAQFGYDNRTCYFLLDHGESPKCDDAKVPVMWYRWTGKLL